jgi:hypothetical protein
MFSKEGPDAIPKSPLCFPIYLILESQSEKGKNRSRNCLIEKGRRLSALRADSRRPKKRNIGLDPQHAQLKAIEEFEDFTDTATCGAMLQNSWREE